MSKISYKAVIPRLEDTEIGRKLMNNPAERKRHDDIVRQLREAARPELEATERSERLTWEDLHGPTFY
jgi:hypothetical protein